MAPEPLNEDVLANVDAGRRDFLKTLVAGTSFAVPLMASFSMDGLSVDVASAQISNMTCSNMTFPSNMTFDNLRLRVIFRGAGSGTFVLDTGDCPVITYRFALKHPLRTVSDDGSFVPGLRLRAIVGSPISEELVIHLSHGQGVIEVTQSNPNIGLPPKVFSDLIRAFLSNGVFVDAFTVKGDFSAPVTR
jgi:hypothetical protein